MSQHVQSFQVGDEVKRIKGGDALGKVVEISGDRLRVFWHTPANSRTKPKRTWIHRAAVIQVQPHRGQPHEEQAPAVSSPRNFYLAVWRSGWEPTIIATAETAGEANRLYDAAFEDPQNAECYIGILVRELSRYRFSD